MERKWREKGNDGFAHWENVMLSLSSVTQRSLAVCGPEIPHKSLVPYFLGSETWRRKVSGLNSRLVWSECHSLLL